LPTGIKEELQMASKTLKALKPYLVILKLIGKFSVEIDEIYQIRKIWFLSNEPNSKR